MGLCSGHGNSVVISELSLYPQSLLAKLTVHRFPMGACVGTGGDVYPLRMACEMGKNASFASVRIHARPSANSDPPTLSSAVHSHTSVVCT